MYPGATATAAAAASFLGSNAATTCLLAGLGPTSQNLPGNPSSAAGLLAGSRCNPDFSQGASSLYQQAALAANP
ncbi:hypothetical protein Ciccas_011640, partial [Cichlidogyrus casuarinus]